MSKKVLALLLTAVMVLGLIPCMVSAAGELDAEITLIATSYKTDGVIVPQYEVEGDETVSEYKWFAADSADAPDGQWAAISYTNSKVKTSGTVTAETANEAYLVLSQSLAGKYIKFQLILNGEVIIFSDPTPMIEFTPNLMNNGKLNTAGINLDTGEVYGWSDGIYDSARTSLKSAGAESGDNWYNHFEFPMGLTAGNYTFTVTAAHGSGASKNYRMAYNGVDQGNGKWRSGKQYAWETGSYKYSGLAANTSANMSFRICTGSGAGAEAFWMKDISLVKEGPYVVDVEILGDVKTGESVDYDYEYISTYDAAGLTENGTIVEWLVSDYSYGPFTSIEIDDGIDGELEGKYLKLKVTPKNSGGVTGPSVTSEPVKIKAQDDAYSIGASDGDYIVSYTNNRAFSSFDMFIAFYEYSKSADVTKLENVEIYPESIDAGDTATESYTPINENNMVAVELLAGSSLNETEFIDGEIYGEFTEATAPDSALTGDIKINYSNGEIRLYGDFDEDVETYDVAVYLPDTDYESITAEDYETSVEFARKNIIANNGKFNVAFKLLSTDVVNQEFIAVISGRDEVLTFKYFNNGIIDFVCQEMLGSTEDELVALFDGEASIEDTVTDSGAIYINDIFKLDLSEYNELDTKYKKNIMADLKEQTLNSGTVSNIAGFLEEAIEEQRAVKAVDDAIAYVTSSSSGMGARLGAKNDILGLDLDAEFGYGLSTNEGFLDMIHSSLVGITDSEEFYDEFEKAVAGAAAKYSDWANVLSVVQANNNIYEVDLEGKFTKLKKAEKTTLGKKLMKKGLNDAETVQDAIDIISDNFEDIVKDIIADREDTSSSGGGGGLGNYQVPSNPAPIVSPITPVVPEGEVEKPLFKDIEDAAWAKDSILALYEKGIVKGTDGNRFEPNRNITRAEFLNMIVSAIGIDYGVGNGGFSDISGNEWYAKAVNTAQMAGIITGDEYGRFNPNQTITREDMAVMLHRAMVYSEIKLNQDTTQVIFADIYAISPYALESVTKLQIAGIINGMEFNKFEPKISATRAMAAKMIYVAVGR